MNQHANKLNSEPEVDEDNNANDNKHRAQEPSRSYGHRHHLRQRKGLDWEDCSRDQRREAAVFQAANQEEIGAGPSHRLRAKFTKSKSSPSSLTTHKFGLRPTPSPPRLIIDHQTGDIVESYPERPVYLHTYQPIEPDEEEQDFEPMSDATAQSNQSTDHRLVSQTMPQQQQQQGRPDEPKQHNHAKVYFAPPATGNSNPAEQPMSSRERARASFRHAIRQLAAEERTDIAIVTEPDDYERSGEPTATRSAAAKPLGQIRITATSASQGEALLADRRNQPATRPHPMSSTASKLYSQPSLRRKQDGSGRTTASSPSETGGEKPKESPAHSSIEDLGLYGWCFSLRVLLVLLISGSIIYLLAVSLYADCVRYRPAFTYVSLITASVNIISVTVFSLFWCCKGVTRHLYQDISASAFIATFYSILVCVNLALGIVFFFTDTCHYERAMASRSAWDHTDHTSELIQQEGDLERHSRGLSSVEDIVSDPSYLDTMLTDMVNQRSATTTTPAPEQLYPHGPLPQMSPLEAFWEYVKELARSFAKSLYRFLIYYDLKFIGGLHALLAVCLQYLAIKVAVARTHFGHSPLIEDV